MARESPALSCNVPNNRLAAILEKLGLYGKISGQIKLTNVAPFVNAIT
jgi:hypothetical protein